MNEHFKILSFNNYYELSIFGNIRNSKTKRLRKIDISKLKETKTRIRVIGILDNDGNKKNFYLHRLIALTFIPNPFNLNEVNHIDGNPYNNCVNNLEWITRADNMKHFNTNMPKYTCKYMRKILLINKENNVIEQSFKCLEECIEKLNLSLKYGKLYRILSNSKNKYKNKEATGPAKGGDRDAASTFGSDFDLGEAGHRAVEVTTKGCDTNEFCLEDNKILKFEDNNSNIIYDVGQRFRKNVANVNSVKKTTEWREIIEAPLYQISNTGLVKLTRLNRFLNGSLINGYKSVTLKTGPKRVDLSEAACDPLHGRADTRTEGGDLVEAASVGGDTKLHRSKIHRLVHRLVAEAFIENDNATKICVDHIDTNKLNNNVTNLRWVSHKENMNNVITKQNISEGKLHKIEVLQINKNTNEIINSFKSLYEASKSLNISYSSISNVCNYYKYDDTSRPQCYKTKSTNGFIFNFLI